MSSTASPTRITRKIESRMLPVTKAGLIGSPDAVISQLRRFESMGFELILCKMIPTVENIQAIAREVIAPMRRGVQPSGDAAVQKSHQPATAR